VSSIPLFNPSTLLTMGLCFISGAGSCRHEVLQAAHG
jgi:hypothetical protein